jgi:hypothetical protein
MDGREEGGEGYRRGMEERKEVRDTDDGWKRRRVIDELWPND